MSYTEMKLNYLLETKELIRDAINAKGQKVSTNDTFRSYADKIAAIKSSSDDVRYVTFMSYDGSTEEGKIPVAVGYDCPNPKFTSTRESDAQYDYTLVGWATTPNGGLDSNALKAVNEDRTVYAAFASVLRSYTITYQDTDGSVLKTENLAYGATPVYTPEKDGFGFEGWSPALGTVTGNATYTATWSELVTFANAGWKQIAEISQNGEASEYFAIGDTKDITLSDGEVITVEIIAFNHDDLADGSGKAGITLFTNHVLKNTYQMNSTATSSGGWASSAMRTLLNSGGLNNKLPETLKEVVKEVTKKTNSPKSSTIVTSADKFWLLSPTEAGSTSNGGGYYPTGQGNRYSIYTSSANNSMLSQRLIKRLKSDDSTQTNRRYWLRSPAGYSNTREFVCLNYNTTNKAPELSRSDANSGAYLAFGFCI